MVMKYILSIPAVIFFSLIVNFSKAQTASADNKLFHTITFHPIPKGPSVFGIFEGRPPCAGLAEQLKISIDADCVKLKCDLTLYRDPVTSQPTNFILSVVGGGNVIK